VCPDEMVRQEEIGFVLPILPDWVRSAKILGSVRSPKSSLTRLLRGAAMADFAGIPIISRMSAWFVTQSY
jgi:hypothetical protein